GAPRSRAVQQRAEWTDRALDRAEVVVVQRPEPLGEPGGPVRADASEHTSAGRRELDVDAAPVAARSAGDEAGGLEPVDVLAHRGSRDTFAGCQVAEADALVLLHLRQQRRLTGSDAEGLRLAAELTGEPRQDR